MVIVFLLIIILLIWAIGSYNKLIRAKNMVKEAASGVDVQLKRRYTLVPTLVETVKGYNQHEQSLFTQITEIRTQGMNMEVLKDKEPIENSLSSMLRNLFIMAEAYPDLKASQNFLDMQKNLIEIEDQIQYARRYYNGAVRDYNNTIESFPSNLMAGIFGFKQEQFFEITLVNERSAPEVKL